MQDIDLIDDFDELEDQDIEIKVKKYEFLGICTSDPCRLINRSNENRTDVGVIKTRDKKVDWCHDCGEALYWHRKVIG